jgi:hypothetical protein
LTSPWQPWIACLALGSAPLLAAEGSACHAQIIVRPAPGTAPLTDEAVLQALGDAARVRLRLIRAIGPALILLRVEGEQNDTACSAAIVRLQADSRLLSVERDVRRQRQGY